MLRTLSQPYYLYLLLHALLSACNTKNEKPSATIFLQPECPLSIQYTSAINNLIKTWNDSLTIKVVFSGKSYDSKTIQGFIKEYNLPSVNCVIDPKRKLAKQLGATITPECFVQNTRGKIIYSGKIDDRIASLGSFRNNATTLYLEDAIKAAIRNEQPPVGQTTAIGCFIE